MNLNDISLIPKLFSFRMATIVSAPDSPLCGHTTEYDCSEETFKTALISKLKEQKSLKSRIDWLKGDIIRADEHLGWLESGHLAMSKRSSYMEENLHSKKARLATWEQQVNDIGVQYYLDQIDQDKGEFISLMLFPMEEWELTN